MDFDGNASFSECQDLKHIPISCLSSKPVDASLLHAGSYEPCHNYLPLPGHSAGSRQHRNKKVKYFLDLIQSFLKGLAKSVELNSAGKDLCMSLSPLYLHMRYILSHLK